jgi:hypothetical protein
MRCQNKWTGMVMGVILGLLFSAVVVLAGGLEPLVGPTAAGSQMVTLDQIYDRINNGTAANKMTEFTEPSSGPTVPTMHTLDDIYTLVGLRAPVSKTGQATCYSEAGAVVRCTGTGQDGDLKKGVVWFPTRFTDNVNGTVTDNLTGLIWLRNANCTDEVGGINKSLETLSWPDALTWSNNLAGGRCGLTDGSTAGQWRLPNVREMESLVHYGFYSPAVPNTHGSGQWTEGDPFKGVQSTYYWSSTTSAFSTDSAWCVSLGYGYVCSFSKTNPFYVWPVRGGQ